MTNISHESFNHVRYTLVPWTDSFPPGPLIPTYLYCVLGNYGRGGLKKKIYSSHVLLKYYSMVHLCVPTCALNVLQYMW